MTQYDAHIDLDEKNTTHVRQLRLIGRDKTVLELGCGTGAMTRHLLGQGCQVTGVEIDAEAAEKAGRFAEQVLVADLDTPGALDELADKRFDVVLAGDVLQHLENPGQLLAKAATLLSDSGYVVASVPNVAHGSLRLSLLQGRWDYSDFGLLDRHHLRFFTHSSLEDLFTDAGLRVERTERVTVSPFDFDPQLNLKDFPSAVVELVSEDPESATLQFVLAAVPATREGALELAPEPDWDKTEKPEKAKVKARTAEPGGPPKVEGVRAVAFYLPQFHPTAENDAWWGKGFTEWTNVTKAEPIWPEHYQPRRPADLGFYDLRLPEVREAQAKLARLNGISAFCYHHYWFGGRRLLQRPFEEVLSSGSPTLPFMLCWANESWSRIWDGGDRAILQDQHYGEDDEVRRHAAYLAKAFNDPRYLKVDDRPAFVIYNVAHLPDARGYIDEFRKACVAETGVEPYLIQAITHQLDKKPAQTGCDAEVEFPPHRLGDKVSAHPDPRLAAGSHLRYEYEDVSAGCLERLDVPWVRYPCVVPSWDNTARRKVRATILHGANPEAYEKWLLAAAEHEARRRPENGLVFVNAWNEWAEGAYLEPDQRFGHGYLEATRRVFGEISVPPPAKTTTTQVGALPADYLDLRDRVVELENEVLTAYERGQKASRAADRNDAKAHSREIARLKQAINDITNGARQTAEWAKSLDKQLKERSTALEEVGHWARSMEVEVENKNRAISDGARYVRELETQLGAKNQYISELESRH
ncbi:2-polyprenyl-3-methyl-5-hydroxy-6-metoxy-1,4-benzoquinol methylase [Kibdelosporangium banguiense]|uniref:2-polyprenyl-3-methyl-5-hydroxy-6-metoxy-1, 4-benzoquinol methylase n=1 Tax=Kibdelosporangium banguiense TaxID=1365924 RepID=A0ABS4TCG4_9PSEU|nr:glycoside hydrolase family 99-like domain-containing protein [Kibdelosporangium banguiense]MBP2321755.1 2-polyprenyl-3-methyl-5-hydroxy-6-metoxy-1,4-benzoquinol methylase [Kibdelosporangium banguiense]